MICSSPIGIPKVIRVSMKKCGSETHHDTELHFKTKRCRCASRAWEAVFSNFSLFFRC